MNSAWPLARYPIVIFLDADDVLLPHAAATVVELWTEATVKAQFPLETVDEAGRRLGHITPRFPHELKNAALRAALLDTGQSPSSPGSGNAYSRSLLTRLDADGGFDLENPREHHMDSILECNAPFYGEVVTIHEPMGCRRIHHSNMYAVNALDSARFAMMIDTFVVKLDYLARRCRVWGLAFDPAAARNHSLWLLECRLVMNKLAPANDPSREPTRYILYHGLKAHGDDDVPAKTRVPPGVVVLGRCPQPAPSRKPTDRAALFGHSQAALVRAAIRQDHRAEGIDMAQFAPRTGNANVSAGSERCTLLQRAVREPSVSLIIATRDRCSQLARCLDAVRSMSFERRWELIVVDNGSIDRTASVIREFIEFRPFSSSLPVRAETGSGQCAQCRSGDRPRHGPGLHRRRLLPGARFPQPFMGRLRRSAIGLHRRAHNAARPGRSPDDSQRIPWRRGPSRADRFLGPTPPSRALTWRFAERCFAGSAGSTRCSGRAHWSAAPKIGMPQAAPALSAGRENTVRRWWFGIITGEKRPMPRR